MKRGSADNYFHELATSAVDNPLSFVDGLQMLSYMLPPTLNECVGLTAPASKVCIFVTMISRRPCLAFECVQRVVESDDDEAASETRELCKPNSKAMTPSDG